MGLQRVGHDGVTKHITAHKTSKASMSFTKLEQWLSLKEVVTEKGRKSSVDNTLYLDLGIGVTVIYIVG